MISLSGKKVLLYPGAADFRLGINGLSALTGQKKERNCVYVFCSKSRKSLKFLEFSEGAAWIAQVRLESGRFQLPQGQCASSLAKDEVFAILKAALANARVSSPKGGEGYSYY